MIHDCEDCVEPVCEFCLICHSEEGCEMAEEMCEEAEEASADEEDDGEDDE